MKVLELDCMFYVSFIQFFMYMIASVLQKITCYLFVENKGYANP